ncbi:MAG: DUF2726 domain-containing protein [bacterium]|nr:DUF2726 domain-containing protein [bacterium]
MMYLYLILAVIFIVWAFRKFDLWELFEGEGNKESKLPYRRKDYLLSATERKFFYALEQIAHKNNYHVFAKVRLEDLLWLPKNTEDRWSFRGRIKSRHIDFVLCDHENIKPLLAIELDDSSHLSEKAQKTDDFKNRALKDAGLPLLRFPHQNFYNADEIASKILKEKAIQ